MGDGRIEKQAGTGKVLKRRGILAAAGAVVAGIVAKQTSVPVAAVTGGTQGTALIIGANNPGGTANTETGTTVLSNNGATYGSYFFADAFVALASTGGTGVIGKSADTGIGVYGIVYPDTASATGVHGSVGAGTGVKGFAVTGTGVSGTTSSGVYGVYGSSSKSGGVGVSGTCTGGIGLLGTVSDGFAVLGQAVTGNGLFGFSQQNHAIVGQTARPYFGGVLGVATLDNTVGIYGSTNNGATNNANAYAGYMDGNFVVANGVKSAAVKHTDGSHRLVYCVESPENWFEDFGEAKLVNGRADVKLDADFAAVVETAGYQVFLTTYGASQGLDVVSRAAGGFAVQERNKGTASLTFGYRIVAKRKDIKTERLAKFELVGKAKHDAKPPQAPSPPPSPDRRP